MIVLGIDPGTHRIGYGVIDTQNRKERYITAGILVLPRTTGEKRLLEIHVGIQKLLEQYRPSLMGIERLRFAKNQKTGLSVAQARGVILLCALQNNIPVQEYYPNEIKAAVTGYGMADKKAVAKMVKLTLQKPDLHLVDDATDALAIALIAGRDKLK